MMTMVLHDLLLHNATIVVDNAKRPAVSLSECSEMIDMPALRPAKRIAFQSKKQVLPRKNRQTIFQILQHSINSKKEYRKRIPPSYVRSKSMSPPRRAISCESLPKLEPTRRRSYDMSPRQPKRKTSVVIHETLDIGIALDNDFFD